jgi:ubiquinone/menaquinone biosynthesis C-methylase UbiE
MYSRRIGETVGMRKAALAAVLGLLGYSLWWRRNPSAMPYWQRFFVELPHPGITRGRLIEILEPQPRDRILEVGPGTGYYALPLAERLGERGRVEIYDLQQEMVDHVMRAAKERGLKNVTGWTGDAQEMLFEKDRFDAAYLAVMLGEIPDQDAALRELARVVKPGGRVVVGEIALDPHYVTFSSLRERAERAGLEFERRAGGGFAYFARFRVPLAAT